MAAGETVIAWSHDISSVPQDAGTERESSLRERKRKSVGEMKPEILLPTAAERQGPLTYASHMGALSFKTGHVTEQKNMSGLKTQNKDKL